MAPSRNKFRPAEYSVPDSVLSNVTNAEYREFPPISNGPLGNQGNRPSQEWSTTVGQRYTGPAAAVRAQHQAFQQENQPPAASDASFHFGHQAANHPQTDSGISDSGPSSVVGGVDVRSTFIRFALQDFELKSIEIQSLFFLSVS